MNTKNALIFSLILVAVIVVAIIVNLNDASFSSDIAINSPLPFPSFSPSPTPPSLSPTPAVLKLPAYKGDPIANIGSDPSISALPEQIVEREKEYLAEMSKLLGENPIDYNRWIGVGTSKKLFKNYQGAIDAWEYAKLLFPTHPLSYLNLADLYGYYLKDVQKAEENYFAAVLNDNVNANGSYYAVANFYRDFGFKDKAIEYYTKLLEFMPNDPAVLTELERLGVKL